MSLFLRRIALDGFRKFRAPMVIDGLTDGLNIVIEDNEAGKSTLLEALRAAFFVRHNTKNQLAQSYAPYGDAVGPRVEVTFEADGSPWSVAKRFLRSASVEVAGPQGRAQGEDAESRLNTLLGSVKDSSRGGDLASYGALGLLWIAQTEALAVSAPGQIVRDSVTATLEAEVGAIMGGPAYKKVRARVEDQYAAFWTPTGQKKGLQIAARERLDSAEIAATAADERLAALDKTFSDVEGARQKLKVVEREIADKTDAQARQSLTASLETARAAAQILATRRAEHEAAGTKVSGLEELQQRHVLAGDALGRAQLALTTARDGRAAVGKRLAEARQRLTEARTSVDETRLARQEAKSALTAGEVAAVARQRAAAVTAAHARHVALLELEREVGNAKLISDQAIAPKLMAELEAHERTLAETRAALLAGATHVVFRGPDDTLFVDGEPVRAGERALVRPTTFRVGDIELTVTPPSSAEAAEAAMAAAKSKLSTALEELGAVDVVAARDRNERARDAAAELRSLNARISAGTPGDPVIDLAAGADALKLFVTANNDEGQAAKSETSDLSALSDAMEKAEDALAKAEGVQESEVEALRRVEQEDAPLAAAEVRAESDVANARRQIEAIEARPEYASLKATLITARERATDCAVKLSDAERDATAHDPVAITKKIESIDARARTSNEARNRLLTEIARLENTIEIEGGAGLGDHAAAAREEVEAARGALERVTLEAGTLKLLRDTLEEVHRETAARFVGPVAKRAKRHIERLLPDCELHFADDLALVTVARGGVSEQCDHLSRGTQEQLAVLTRIAFADMLLEQGRPVSLILDDPLVYSDDARLDVMVDILLEAAERMQVILLTCRDRAFRHIPGTRLQLAGGAA